MLVCHCAGINDERVRDVIAAGARDEFDVADACGAGAQCGGCLSAVAALLAQCATCPRRTAALALDTPEHAAIG